MLQLTHRDYFQTTGTGNNWTVQLKRCSKKILYTYHEELIDAARLIHNEADSPITLLFSGGIYSEYMLNIFQRANIPFSVAIISYGKYNEHDTNWAFRYCNSRSINPTIVDIDIDKFISNGDIYTIANSVQCAAYQIPSIMSGISKLDGTVVMANGEPYIKNFDGVWKYEETERVNSYMRWFKNNSIDGTPDFLRYTPEATLSFLYDPTVIELTTNKCPGKLSTRTSKHKIFSQDYNIEPRPKYTGWEQIEKLKIFKEVTENFQQLKDNHNGVFELEVSLLKNMLAA
jgi:hypothetical protein